MLIQIDSLAMNLLSDALLQCNHPFIGSPCFGSSPDSNSLQISSDLNKPSTTGKQDQCSDDHKCVAHNMVVKLLKEMQKRQAEDQKTKRCTDIRQEGSLIGKDRTVECQFVPQRQLIAAKL